VTVQRQDSERDGRDRPRPDQEAQGRLRAVLLGALFRHVPLPPQGSHHHYRHDHCGEDRQHLGSQARIASDQVGDTEQVVDVR
jgi:hypothetical protein